MDVLQQLDSSSTLTKKDRKEKIFLSFLRKRKLSHHHVGILLPEQHRVTLTVKKAMYNGVETTGITE